MHGRDKRSTLESYNSLGGRLYDIRYSREQTAKFDAIMTHMTPSEDDIVLDDGCGTGLLSGKLETFAVGIDLSSRLLLTARRRLRERGQAHLIQADADLLPFRDDVFDKVFAVTLIQNVPRPLRTLLEIKRVARARSSIAVTALKKYIDSEGFRELLDESGLALRTLIEDEKLKDWLAIAES